jgi:hypothetical protein
MIQAPTTSKQIRARRGLQRLCGALALGLLACPTLFGAELPEAPEGSFSVVVIPDTQHYRRLEPDDQAWENPVFEAYTRWTAANLQRQRIVFVSHFGDIVDLNERPQWSVARRCMDRLHGHVPYAISVGNHDMVRNGDSSLFQEFFPKSRFAEFDWYGGTFAGAPDNAAISGNNANSFQLFSAEGLRFVIVHLECNAPDNVLDWANEVLSEHADRRAIVTTHMGLGPRDRPKDAHDYFDAPKGRMIWTKCHGERGNSPQQMWEKCFRRHGNLFMICCGDQSRTQAMRQASRGDHGNTVHELLSDYGAGGLRVMRFVPDANRIEVRTWNPITNELNEGTKIVPDVAQHQFVLEYPTSTKDSGELSFEVVRELSTPTEESQQGIGTDGRHLYLQTSDRLLKYDLDGKLLARSEHFQWHHGGITVLNGKIYCAASECTKKGTEKHWIHVYDAESLKFIAAHDVGQHFTVCAGGIAHHDGRFFVAESFFDNDHADRIVEFDAAFRHVRTHETEFKSPYGIQGLEYLPATDQFQIHSHGPEFYRINSRFESASIQAGKASYKLQDVARLKEDVLIVNSRNAQKVLFVRIVEN